MEWKKMAARQTVLFVGVLVLLGCVNCLPRRDRNDFSNDILVNDYESNSVSQFQDLTSNELPTYDDWDVDQQQQEVQENVVDEEDEQNKNLTAMYRKNPCVFERCSGGAMCVVKDLEKLLTECVCPETCAPDDSATAVCSVMGVEYANKCELHKAACSQGKNIEIAYETACVEQSRKCTDENMEVFPARFLDWSMMVRDEELYGEANLKKNLVDLPQGAQTHIAQWMFDRQDTNKNSQLDSDEAMQLKMYLISVEHCIENFLKECDDDKDGSIQIREWKLCLLPGSNSVDDEYFNGMY